MRNLPLTDTRLKDLFGGGCPNDAMLFASLDGRYPGCALVDDAENPKQCVLRTAVGTLFLGGSVSDSFLTNTLEILRKRGTTCIVLTEDEARMRDLPEGYSFNHERVEFNSNDFSNERVSSQLPTNCRIAEMDLSLLEDCVWGKGVKHAYGSLDNFLAYGFGICLLQEDQILSEAYAMFEGAGRVELGVVTHEDYRGQRYGSIACSELIRRCRNLNKPVYWSCDRDNVPSVKLAQRLGFLDERNYRWIQYDAT